jgi:hypothetical protein
MPTRPKQFSSARDDRPGRRVRRQRAVARIRPSGRSGVGRGVGEVIGDRLAERG